MNEIIQLLTSPVFWFTAGVMSVIMSVVGAYATRGSDRAFGWASARLRNRSAKKRAQFEAEAVALSMDADALLQKRLDYLDQRSSSQFLMLAALLFFGMAMALPRYSNERLVVLIGLLFAMIAAIRERLEAVRTYDVCRAARQRQKEVAALANSAINHQR